MEPINIIESAIYAQTPNHKTKFLRQIQHLYQYDVFKAILDTVTTKIKAGQLIFKIEDKEIFALDEGNCKSMTYEDSGGILGFNKKKRYVITIKKISTSVIMHEIAHMIEQELQLLGQYNSEKFKNAILRDIMQIKHTSNNILLKTEIEQVMIKEVQNYPQNHYLSELFARFFQIFASSKEVIYDLQHTAKYDWLHITKAFPNTLQFFNTDCATIWHKLINSQISQSSQKYILSLEDIAKQNKWADRKIDSIHHPKQFDYIPNSPQIEEKSNHNLLMSNQHAAPHAPNQSATQKKSHNANTTIIKQNNNTIPNNNTSINGPKWRNTVKKMLPDE